MGLYVVGWAGQGAYAPQFAGSSTTPCFSDTTSGPEGVYATFEAWVDDLFIIDATGQVRYIAHLHDLDLQERDNRNTVDGWVRALLSE